MVFNCILCYLSPKIVIFQEPLETNVIGFGMPQTLNMCDWSHFDTFLPVKINKMWNFWLKLWFFRNSSWLKKRTWNLWQLEQEKIPETLGYAILKPFWCIFPSQNQQNVKFLAVMLNSPWQKMKKETTLIWTGKKCLKRLEWDLHIGGLLGMPITMHYVYNFVWQILFELLWFFLNHLLQEGLSIGFWNMLVGVEWDQRRTAA